MRHAGRPVTVVAAALASACTSASPNVSKGNGQVTGKPLKGGTVTVAEVGASPNFILYPPATNRNGYNVNLTEGQWPYLVYAGDGAKAVVNPDESLFSSLKYSHNNSVITIVLKPWSWSDGVPITSRDFTFVYNLLKVNYLNWLGYTQGLFPTDVKEVLTPNAHTIVLDLDKSYNPTFYTDNELSLALIPQHPWDKTSVNGKVGNYDETRAGAKAVYAFLQKQGGLMSTFDSNPLWKVVDGPWTLQTFNSNGYYAWVPNKNYSGPDKPRLNKVVWTPFTTDTGVAEIVPYSPSKAIALLKAHGWKVVPHGVSTCQHPGTGPNECGVGVKAGEPMQFQLMYTSGNTSFDQQNASIQSTEAVAGVKIVLDPVPFNTIVSTTGYCNAKSHPTSTCSWQLQDYGYNPYKLDPNGSGQFNTDGYGNYGGYSSAEEDSLIKATEFGSQPSAFFGYEDYPARQLPYLWLPNEAGVFVYKKNLAGITPWNPFSGTLNPELWYYTKSSS